MSTSEATRRTWIALGIAEVLFAVAYPACAALAMEVPAENTRDGWAALGLFATLLVAGVFAVVVGVPIGVHTVGRLTAKWMEGRSSPRAASAHLVVGLGLGALVAGAMILVASMEPPAAVVAFVVPVGLVGMGTNVLMPLAVRHAWIRVSAWVLGAVPVLAALSLLASFGLRAAS